MADPLITWIQQKAPEFDRRFAESWRDRWFRLTGRRPAMPGNGGANDEREFARQRHRDVLIQTRARESLRLGRFVLHIDDFAKLVRIEIKQGPGISADERRNVEKFLKIKRPDIIRDDTHTGWGIEASIDLAR